MANKIKPNRRPYIPERPWPSAEVSPDELRKVARNIVNYEANKIFYTRVLPISIFISALISILVLR